MTGAPTATAGSRTGPLYAAGLGATLLFHIALGGVLFAAGGATENPTGTVEQRIPDGPRRRGVQTEVRPHKRRTIEGPWHRAAGFTEERFDRRVALLATTRRQVAQEINHPFRSLTYGAGRRGRAAGWNRDRRGLDFPPRDEEVLVAMLIPRLGGKKAEPKELPRLVKYEQPEKFEDAVNIRENTPEEAKELKKAAKQKKAELDKRRKKRPSLTDLIDAPEDDDPRKRAVQLDSIIGVNHGSVHGVGTEGKAGDVYLGQIERNIRLSFIVPVFLTEEELKRLKVDVMITRIDEKGHVLSYRVTRKSGNPAYDGAAIDAIRRFVPAEGGSKTLPAPPPEMLDLINRRGVLVKLEGSKLK
ncbi:MAG: TonB C-terminal domain-containing protein [Pseudomonadota bacterium]